MSDLLVGSGDPRLQSRWIRIRDGAVSAAGAPSRDRLGQWYRCGATDVVTLQRADEMRPWLPEAVTAQGLAWHPLPLSGRRLQRASDRDTLARIVDLTPLLDEAPPRRLVFHCAAGLHRTSVAVYLLLRACGLQRDAAVDCLRCMRPITAEAFLRPTRRAPALIETAEAAFGRLRVDDRGPGTPAG